MGIRDTPESHKEYMRLYRKANRATIRQYYRSWRGAHKDEVNEYFKDYRAKNKGKLFVQDRALAYERYKRWADKNPTKIKAEQTLNRAVRKGLVLKTPCITCSNPISVAHHPDYTKALEVIWLCHKHHRAIHYGSAPL